MNSNRTNDYGKMRRDGETFNRKQFAITLQKYLRKERLEKEHKRSNRWRTPEMDYKWLWTKRLDSNTKKAQPKGINDDQSPVTAKYKRAIRKLALRIIND